MKISKSIWLEPLLLRQSSYPDDGPSLMAYALQNAKPSIACVNHEAIVKIVSFSSLNLLSIHTLVRPIRTMAL